MIENEITIGFEEVDPIKVVFSQPAVSDIEVDSEITPSGTNPVQGKAIYAALKEISESIVNVEVDSELDDKSTNPVQNKEVAKAVRALNDGKMNNDPMFWPDWTDERQKYIQSKIGIISVEGVKF